MRRVLSCAVLLFALASGTAAACDLAGPVPGPGHVYLFDAKTGAEADVPVTGRWLGAGCELSNPFAFNGNDLVWSEGPERSDAAQTFHHRKADGTRTTLPIEAKQVRELGLTATHVYYLTQGAATGSLGRMRLSDHQATTVPVAVPFHTMLSGAHAGWFSSDGKRVNVYDAAEQEWVIEGQTLTSLGVEGHDQGQLHALGDGSAFFSTYSSTQSPTTTYRYWTYEFATKDIHEITGVKFPHASALDDATLYYTGYEGDALHLYAMPAAGGTARDLGSLPHELGHRLVVVGSTVVLASYTHKGVHRHEADPSSSQWLTSPEEGPEGQTRVFPLPGAGLAAIVVSMAVAAADRRRSA